jgi:hypothetical protein
MVDYRKRLSDMTTEERAEVAPSADNFSKVFGDRTEEPMSVTAADTTVSLATPVDSVVEVQKELQKEEPDYLKIGMLAGVEALGSLPALGPVAKSMIRKGADLAKQTDNVIEGTTNIPPVSKKEVSPFDVEYDYDLTLKMENMIDEWAKGNVTNANLRKNLATLDIKLPYRISPKADPSSLDIQMPDGTIYKGTGDVPSKPKTMVVDESLPTKDAANITDEDLSAWKKDPKNTTSDERRKQLKGRDETLTAIAKEYQDSLKANGAEASRELLAKYRAAVDEINPIKPITTMPELIDNIDVVGALGEKTTTLSKKKTGILSVNRQFRQDEIVTSRLDINGYTNHDKWVAAVRTTEDVAEGFSPTAYGKAVFLKDVDMLQPEGLQKKSLRIAAGAEKGPHAVMQGKYQQLSPEEVYQYAESVFEDSLKEGSEWVQIGYNPVRAGFFYDRATGLPLEAAEEVIQVGNLVLGKNVKKGNIEDYAFNKGGMAMEEQTQMAFALGGSVEEVDPVSGNEVPPGSLPEEVRDDIDARLSEGEYVVPADVVRYYGVKFFEDLRTQAKSGFEDMEANGRIGGQPVPEENPLPFDVSELQVEEEPVQMNEGGLLDREALEAKFPASFMGSGGPAQEWKTFENEAGLTITIRFVDGKPMSVIPAGYTEVGARSEQALEAPRGDDSDPQFGDPSNTPEAVDLSSLSTDELEKLGNSAADAGTIEKILGYGSPLLGDILGLTREMKAANINAEIVKRLKSGTNIDGTPLTKSDITQLGKMFDTTVDDEDSGSFFFGGQRSLTEGLQNNSGDYEQGVGAPIVGFADTFLGDLLGFDGTPGIQATDKDGNKLGLDASISGKRRKPVEKPTVTTPSNNDGGDDNYSAADAMRDRLDKQTKDEGQTGGFQGSATGSSVYAGGNRAEGGLMLKKDKKKKK